MGNRPSFRPTAASEGTRPYAREGLLRYNDTEEEEDDETTEEEEDDDDDDDEAAPPVPADAEGVEVAPLQVITEAEDEEEDEAAT